MAAYFISNRAALLGVVLFVFDSSLTALAVEDALHNTAIPDSDIERLSIQIGRAHV